MSKITNVHARQIIDCKRRPMVEVDVTTDDGFTGTGSAPTGSSVGMYESYVLRDNDPSEFNGLSVHKAVSNVNDIIAPALIGFDIEGLAAIDNKMIELDGTPNKKNLGGNAIYSVSVAAIRAAAAAVHMPVYQYLCRKEYGHDITNISVPSFNIMNGGKNHGITQAFNEIMITPYKADDIYEAVEIGCRVFEKLGKVIEAHTHSEAVIGRSYGYACPTENPEEAIELMQEAIDKCGYHDKVCFSADCASSETYDKDSKTYYLDGKRVTGEELVSYAKSLTEKYPFLFVEDLLDENDWDNFAFAVKEMDKTIIIGDDLIATTPSRLIKAIETKATEGFILKPNQVGTLTEAFNTYHIARRNSLYSIPSGRAGGVVGDIVMDLAVGLQIPFIKNGSPCSGERIDKLNFLMRAADTFPEARIADLSNIVKF